jgi:NAD(P)-dependent dehydrogenase (short-subunit alcohol dehydrogenase family)
MASTAGLRGGYNRGAYGAAKAGVISLTKVMAVELAKYNITVNTIAPGAIETEMVRKMHTSETRKIYTDAIPQARYGTPEEVATTALFLASEEASYINGHTLAVDGGFLAAGLIKREG